LVQEAKDRAVDRQLGRGWTWTVCGASVCTQHDIVFSWYDCVLRQILHGQQADLTLGGGYNLGATPAHFDFLLSVVNKAKENGSELRAMVLEYGMCLMSLLKAGGGLIFWWFRTGSSWHLPFAAQASCRCAELSAGFRCPAFAGKAFATPERIFHMADNIDRF